MPRKTDDTEQHRPKSTTVKPDDTVESVAERLGVTVEHLREANGLRHDLLAHGLVLHA